jgi:hypothetical protein
VDPNYHRKRFHLWTKGMRRCPDIQKKAVLARAVGLDEKLRSPRPGGSRFTLRTIRTKRSSFKFLERTFRYSRIPSSMFTVRDTEELSDVGGFVFEAFNNTVVGLYC